MSNYRAKIDGVFLKLHAAEMPFVARVVKLSQPKPLSTLIRWINLLYDGWIYSFLLLFLLIRKDWKLIFVAGFGVVISFIVYYLIKPQLARTRPYHFTTILAIPSRCLDQYSFPSGHCMTLAVLSVLLSWHHPAIIPLLLLAGLLLCWARMAAAHHYPSDLIAGIVIGMAVGVVVARILL